MSYTLLSIKPTFLYIKKSILNIVSYLTQELNYIYFKSNESFNFEFNQFNLETNIDNLCEIQYPNSTTKYEKEDNTDNIDNNGWGLFVFIDEYEIKNEVCNKETNVPTINKLHSILLV